jgi:hypothetical protein
VISLHDTRGMLGRPGPSSKAGSPHSSFAVANREVRSGGLTGDRACPICWRATRRPDSEGSSMHATRDREAPLLLRFHLQSRSSLGVSAAL